MVKRTIWVNAGEASGDMHGAALIAAMKKIDPDLAFEGMGGPAMTWNGCEVVHSMKRISLVGFTEVFSGLPSILRLLGRIKSRWKRQPPDAVILIDCPDFNFRLASAARKFGIPVYYYISPQVWAWRKYRVKFLKKHVRKMLCILPFEAEFYKERGMNADYVGHPLLDEIPLDETDAVEPEPFRVGIMPGSRAKEIASLMPEFAEAALSIHEAHPRTRFSLFPAPGVDVETLMEYWPPDLEADTVKPANRYKGMRRASLLLAASGTATLEAALIGTPAVVAYKLSPLTFSLGKLVVSVPFISLPNLIMERGVFPELLQQDACARVLADIADQWLADPAKLEAIRRDLADLRTRLGTPGAPKRAARVVLEDMGGSF